MKEVRKRQGSFLEFHIQKPHNLIAVKCCRVKFNKKNDKETIEEKRKRKK